LEEVNESGESLVFMKLILMVELNKKIPNKFYTEFYIRNLFIL